MASFKERVLGSYRLVERVGQGWPAEVYRAEHRQLGREAAVKVLAGYLAGNSEFLRRFQREAASAAALNHPHILPIWDYGEQDGVAYLVTPFIRGGSLRDRLRQGQLPVSLGIAYLRQLARALDHAHAQGFIHRDVRPATILIHERDHLYLTDFGMAAALADAPGPAQVTGTLPAGTPEYMAPEQALGRAEPRSDLYSLAIIAYELLAGRVPFRGSSPAETMALQVTEPLPLEPLQRKMPTTSPVLEWALAKDPATRYRTGGAFVEALADALAAAPASAASQALPFGLSAREAEVLALVAQGLSDAQVAERLFLSPYTVKAHLRSVYTKLGTSSRIAAARLAAEHHLT